MATIEDVEAAIDQDNVELRAEFVAIVPCVTLDQLICTIEPRQPEAAAILAGWKAESAVFSVEYEDNELFPAFQFRNGAPKPIIGQVLRELSPDLSRWNIAFWWTAGNGWFDGGVAPADYLDQ